MLRNGLVISGVIKSYIAKHIDVKIFVMMVNVSLVVIQVCNFANVALKKPRDLVMILFGIAKNHAIKNIHVDFINVTKFVIPVIVDLVPTLV